MEVAASMPNGLKVFPLRMMAREGFPSLQQVPFRAEAVPKEAADEIEEGEVEWCSLEADHVMCKDQLCDNAVSFSAESFPTRSCGPFPLANETCTPAPRSRPHAHDVQLELSVDALLSSLDKLSSPAHSKGLLLKSTQGSLPSEETKASSSGQPIVILRASSSQQLSSPKKFSAIASPPSLSQAAVTSLPFSSPSKQSKASFTSKKPQESSSRARQSSMSPTADSCLKAFPLLKPSIPQASPAAGVLFPTECNSKQPVNDRPQLHAQAFSPQKLHSQGPSLPNHRRCALEQKYQVSQESTCARLIPQTAVRAMSQGCRKRAFITCENGNKRPRSSAVRDYPEGCGKNLHIKLHGDLNKSGTCHVKAGSKIQTVKGNSQPDVHLSFSMGQMRTDQNLLSSQEVHSLHPAKVMKDRTVLSPYKLPKKHKLKKPMKWKHDAGSSPESLLQQGLTKPEVWHVSCFSTPVKATLPPAHLQERTPQIEWLPDNQFDCATLAKKTDNVQGPKRSGGRPKGVKFAKKSVILPDGVDKLLSAGPNGVVSARFLVKRTLQEFDCVRRSLAMLKERHQRPDLAAASILKKKGRWRNCGTEKIIGNVPGVEVGDQFGFRIEMLVIGLHRQVQGGIDYISGTVRPEGPLATSIVASGGYEDDDDYGDTFIYTGQGGNNYKGDRRQACNQVLKRGNLALSNSFKERTPVRVIRGSHNEKFYTYDGLYDVVNCWFQTGASGFGVYQYKLSRRPGQPELGSSIVRFVGSVKQRGLVRPHLLLGDISNGKEARPICVLNEVDEELAPNAFHYVHKMRYPSWYHPEMSKGCDCVGGCVDASRCLCAAKNGGEFPYNDSGQIVRGKNVVFECGKSCACSGLCHNRLSQRGPKHQLEVFKTSKRGWGVRSLEPIRPGDFICEYVGELLSDEDAEKRIEQDEYLFDIGNKTSAWSDVSELLGARVEKSIVPVVEDAGFTIDARLYGGVARFINHSCSPNLFTQNVFYDSDDLRFPHVTLFSMENIPPMRELSYDYNYTIGHVRDANGNVKSKECYCNVQGCRGRLY